MKNSSIFLFILLLAFSVNSCTGDFDELNTNPLSLTDDKVDASLILEHKSNSVCVPTVQYYYPLV